MIMEFLEYNLKNIFADRHENKTNKQTKKQIKIVVNLIVIK